jgi:hypothetical protein
MGVVKKVMFLVSFQKYITAEEKEPWGIPFSDTCRLVEVFQPFRAMH